MKELEEFIGQIIKKLNNDENKSAPNSELSQNKNEYNCKQCFKPFTTQSLLKEHRTVEHPPNISCKVCGENFQERWMLEVHLKSHPELVAYSCDICDKEFGMKWRLRKHKENHENLESKKCHYFNNNKTCPYHEIGCKFVHEVSEKCYFGKQCTNKLCSYRHNQRTVTDFFETSIEEIYADDKSDYMRNVEHKNSSKECNAKKNTSTPKKSIFQCEDCTNDSECVECIVRRFRRGRNGGVTTAPGTPTLGSGLGYSSWSSPRSSGGASTDFV